jgi:hypothetical protein
MKDLHEARGWQSDYKCWYVLASKLLKVRYGVNPEELSGDEWIPLYWNLGPVSYEDRYGYVMLIIFHAIGWAGLGASLIAPALRNSYYIGFCLFMILNGLIHDYYVVMRKNNPRVAPHINIRAVLKELREISHNSLPSKENSEPGAKSS